MYTILDNINDSDQLAILPEKNFCSKESFQCRLNRTALEVYLKEEYLRISGCQESTPFGWQCLGTF
jgi:hypothetical protein